MASTSPGVVWSHSTIILEMMSNNSSPTHQILLLIATLLLQSLTTINSIGVNYGTLGDNLPPPSQVAQFLKDKTIIDRIKIFDVNPEILRAFANTGISVTVTVPNGEIPNLTNIRYARRWVNANVKPFYPQTKISCIAVGNEILHWGPQAAIDNLVPAMGSLHHALIRSGIHDVKVSTPHSLAILVSSEPPSQASFRPGWDLGVLAPMLQFCRQTKSPFMVNPYPYFGFTSLDMALFRPNPGYVDRFTGKLYTNMFDMLMDAVYTSMKKLGYGDVEIVVAETGWPSVGEAWLQHVSVENAASYNGGLLRKVSSGVGTPLMPGKRFETYIFGLFNENQKPGSIAEKNFGLFRPDFTPVYDIGIMRGGAQPLPKPALPLLPAQAQPQGKKWCVAKAEASDIALKANIDYACSKGSTDCKPTQPGGPCFDPNNVRAIASFIMNSYYQTNGRNDISCSFGNTGIVTTIDPSKSYI
ncbi:hypothetical protein LguiA_023685 [Lonicera macranthoides]